MGFLSGFACCYALGAAIELRNIIIWHRETGREIAGAGIVLAALMWPALNWIEWEED